jgi:ABC-type glycerol-3-phosphate transport system substrate-binding protein
MTQYNGKSFAFPNGFNAKLWFYRKDIFDQAGVDPTKVKNLDDFIAAGKAIQKINPKYKMWTLGASNPMYQYMMELSGTSARFADENGKFLLTSDPNFRKVLEVNKRLLDEGIVSNIDEWTPDWERAFADEIYVSYLNCNWLVASQFIPKYAPDQAKKWHVTQWPSLIGEVGGSEAGGAIYTIPIYSKESDLAKEYLSLRIFNKEGWFANQKYGGAAIPMMRSWSSDPRSHTEHFYVAGDYTGELMKSMETFKIFPWDPAAALELAIVNPYFDAAINGRTSIDEALSKAQADMENQIGNPWDM